MWGKAYELFTKTSWFIISPFLQLFKGTKTKKFLLYKQPAHFEASLQLALQFKLALQAKSSNPIKCYWIHAASAGELEQVIPIAKALHDNAGVWFYVSYLSPSAEPFIKNFSGLLGHGGLPLDLVKNYKKIILTLDISEIFIVRYDFWPGMLQAAQACKVPLNLLAASRLPAKQHSFYLLTDWWRSHCLKKFRRIFAVTPADGLYFSKLKLPGKIIVAGDAKWARAKERVKAISSQGLPAKLLSLAHLCENHKQQLGSSCFVFGSPHTAEHQIAMSCLTLNGCFVIYVPHEVGKSEVEHVRQDALKSKGRPILFSELTKATPTELKHVNCIIIDSIGHLAEIYALADVAIVGGGFDGQIHNVLEPTAYPVVTLFGDSVQKSSEAKALIQAQACKTFSSSQDLYLFLSQCVNLPSRAAGVLPQLTACKEAALQLFATMPVTSEVVLRNII